MRIRHRRQRDIALREYVKSSRRRDLLLVVQRHAWRYILGVRMRRTKEAREEVLARPGRYPEVHPRGSHAKAPSPIAVKEVWVDERRYIVCRNADQATKDAHNRTAIVAALRTALARGDKSLIGNHGFRRFVAGSGERWAVDESKIADEARYDGSGPLPSGDGTGLNPLFFGAVFDS